MLLIEKRLFRAHQRFLATAQQAGKLKARSSMKAECDKPLNFSRVANGENRCHNIKFRSIFRAPLLFLLAVFIHSIVIFQPYYEYWLETPRWITTKDQV